MLRQRQMSAEKTAVGLETIERNARLQTQMIEDLLDVSRIVSGKVCLKLFPVDLVRTVETAVKALSPDAEARGIELVSFCDEGVSLVRGDATRLQQVVSNLLSNAIKFTPPSGRVEIRLSEDGEPGAAGGAILSGPSPVHSVSIVVSDTGIGISKEFLPLVFDRFRQADSTSTRNYGGLGLGLAIVRHLVELHGGSVWAESPGEGLGSTFGVRLPIEKR
jgi:signal transduction histidine kinase